MAVDVGASLRARGQVGWSKTVFSKPALEHRPGGRRGGGEGGIRCWSWPVRAASLIVPKTPHNSIDTHTGPKWLCGHLRNAAHGSHLAPCTFCRSARGVLELWNRTGAPPGRPGTAWLRTGRVVGATGRRAPCGVGRWPWPVRVFVYIYIYILKTPPFIKRGGIVIVEFHHTQKRHPPIELPR